MTERQEVVFIDEVMADGGVHRRYSDGRQEWRWRGDEGVVTWRDDRDDSGTDELLGTRIVKRAHAAGQVVYGRDLGYGRTVWGRGDRITINRTSFGGRMGAILAGLGAGFMLGPVVLPPVTLTPEEEEELRRAAEEARDAAAQRSYLDLSSTGDWDDEDVGFTDGITDDFG